jgi:hypothetical protein
MTAIREFIKVENHKLEINLPEDFDYEEVEVIIMPKLDSNEDWSFLEKEIDIGLSSGISPRSHESILKDLKEKYA